MSLFKDRQLVHVGTNLLPSFNACARMVFVK